jgi:hypothetical protein
MNVRTNRYFTWPSPTIESERWRYETIKQAKEAVKGDSSQFDPRIALKISFNETVKKTAKLLSQALGETSSVDQASEKYLEDISLAAARWWIDMGTQRSRIYVVLPGFPFDTIQARLQVIEKEVLHLNVNLELRKYGDAKGQDLTIMEVLTKSADFRIGPDPKDGDEKVI